MIYSCAGLIEYIHEVGFLPLWNSGIEGYAAEEIVDEECRYTVFPDGGWEWLLWKWKGEVITEGGCVYGKFFNKKAGFISREWWADFCNYRRSVNPLPAEDSIEATILQTLQEHGSLISRELRDMCGFSGTKMRSTFDAYITRLQMACRIVTEDFVYAKDRHGRDYGWGLSLLTTPERLYGREACLCERTPEESFMRIKAHMEKILPDVSDKQILRLIK